MRGGSVDDEDDSWGVDADEDDGFGSSGWEQFGAAGVESGGEGSDADEDASLQVRVKGKGGRSGQPRMFMRCGTNVTVQWQVVFM